MRQLCVVIAGLLSALEAKAQDVPTLPPDQCRLEALYRLTYQPDSTDLATRTDLLRLQVGTRLSRCVSQSKLFQDSLMDATLATLERQKASGELPTINFQGIPSTRFRLSVSAIVYKLPDQVLVYDQMGTTRYVYPEPANALLWVITPATALVAGYACQRATASWAGRTWEAWFTREVPAADGPYKYSGLPGLIVKVGDGRGHYIFELVKITKPLNPKPIVLPAPGARTVNRATFRQGKAEYDRTILTQLTASGNLRFNGAEDAADAQKRARPG